MPPLPTDPNIDSFFTDYTEQNAGGNNQQLVARMMALYNLTMFRSLTPAENAELQGLVNTLRPQGLVPPQVINTITPQAVTQPQVKLDEPSFSAAELRTAVVQDLMTQDEANRIAAGAPPTSVLGRERVNQIAASTLWDAPGQQITPPQFEKGEIDSAGWAELVKENRETAEVYYRWLLSQGIKPSDAVREMAVNEVIYNPGDGTGVAYNASSGEAIGLVDPSRATSPAGVGGPGGAGGTGSVDPYAGMTAEQRNAAMYDEKVAKANAAIDTYAQSLGVQVFKGDVPGTGFYYDEMGRRVPIAYIDSRGRVEAGTPQTSNRFVQGPGGFTAVSNAPRARQIAEASRIAGAPMLTPAQAATVAHLGAVEGARYAKEVLGLPYVPGLAELVEMRGGVGGVAGPGAPSLPWARAMGPEALFAIASGTATDPEFEARTKEMAQRLFPDDPYKQEVYLANRLAGFRINQAYELFRNPLPVAGLSSGAVKYAQGANYTYDEEKGDWVSGNVKSWNPETQQWDAQRMSTKDLGTEYQSNQVDPAAQAQQMANALNQAKGLGYGISPSNNGWTIVLPDGSQRGGYKTQQEAESALALIIVRMNQTESERNAAPWDDPSWAYRRGILKAPPTPIIGTNPYTESGTARPRPPSGPTHPDLPPPTDTGPVPPQVPLPDPYPLPVFAFAGGGSVTTMAPPQASMNSMGQPNLMLNEPAVIQGAQSGRVYGVAGEAGTQEQVQFKPTAMPQDPAAVPPPQGMPAPMVPMGAPKAANTRSAQQAQSLLKVAKTSNVPVPELEAAVADGRWKEAAKLLAVPMSQVLRAAAKV